MVSAPDIPGHRVAGVLGTGGFATVYRSWQLAVNRYGMVGLADFGLASITAARAEQSATREALTPRVRLGQLPA